MQCRTTRLEPASTTLCTKKPERQSDLRQIEQWLPSVLAGAARARGRMRHGLLDSVLAPVASTVVAIDSAPETLRDRSRAGRRIPTCSFQVGDAYAPVRDRVARSARLSQDSGSPTFHSSGSASSCWAQRGAQPGARVVFLDNLFVEGSFLSRRRAGWPRQHVSGRRLSDGSMHRVLKNFPTEAQLHALAARAWGVRSPIAGGSTTGPSSTVCLSPNPSIERTSSSKLRLLAAPLMSNVRPLE